MEPNKFEMQIKEQLNAREIKPSAMAWDKLDAMLSETEKQKTKFPWLYVAASFVGFLIVGTLFFDQKESLNVNQENRVVFQNLNTSKTTIVHDNSVKLKTEEEKDLVTNVVQSTTSKANKIPGLNEKSIIENINSNQNQVAEVSIINQKVEQKLIKSKISDATIDELLAVVEHPSKKEEQLNQKLVVRVNPDDLLSQVDGELELSFREKVINKLSKNYQTVKIALTNRNLE
ncbi:MULTISPECIES: hypothetical protein [unclassified Flavobacterium]|uniref:hypothetical protein n=1 Tax=unclassified Flavobacterium TaxID=196869 RepID=UPI00131E3309|nr:MULTISPECIES: hypothetical protein [unclassified Flavobacterium]